MHDAQHMIHTPLLKDQTTAQVEFRILTVSYYDKSEAWTIFLLREFYFTLYLYMCFISRSWGHGLVSKVPTSKHGNLNPITDAHIKSMYLHQSTGQAACWPVSPVKSVSFQFSSNPCLERVKWKGWGDGSGGKVIAAHAWKPDFKIAALVHRPGLAELSHKLSPESIVVRRTWRQQDYRDLLDSRVPSSVTNPVSSR